MSGLCSFYCCLAGSDSKEVFQRFMIIGILEIIFGSSLLICGIAGVVYGDGGYFGPPYFTGSFITGVFVSTLKKISYLIFT